MATVIPTEQAVDMLLDDHRVPTDRTVRGVMEYMKARGLIEPIWAVAGVIDNTGSPYDIARVYAAVELGWDTVLVDFEGESSG